LKRNLTHALESWIAAGFHSIGQITILPQPNGGYELRHIEDLGRADLHLHTSVEDARALSFFDDANVYRPLKTAPTLRHGWRLHARSTDELRAALDHFYPAMTALWLSHLQGELRPVPLRETLGRQTGMYAATKRLLDDEGQELVGKACAASACTKRMMWPFSEDQPLTQLPAEDLSCEPRVMADGSRQIPLLCHEACNILVAACREVVKKRERAQSPPQSAGGHSGGH
jgi:sirohydrochlorin cobaltochelatase